MIMNKGKYTDNKCEKPKITNLIDKVEAVLLDL